MAKNLKYEEKSLTLVEVLQSRRLPEVVKIFSSEYDDPERLGCRDYSRIYPDTEIMLQNIQKVKYARIKILKSFDKDNVQCHKKNGQEFVMEHDIFFRDEFLIPLKYRGKVKFVHRPGRCGRYATVSQVIDDLPRYVKVAEETGCFSAHDLQKRIKIPAKTTLELKRKFQNPRDGSSFLECSGNNDLYAFHEDDQVSFTEVEDPKLYNLFELARFKMLPKVILFEKVPLEDMILGDMKQNRAALSIIERPLELLGFTDVEVLISWVREKDTQIYRTLLIPKAAWNTTLVQRRIFPESGGKEQYIERNYDQCSDSGFIDKYMYLMSTDMSTVTLLRNPDDNNDQMIDNEMVGGLTEATDKENDYVNISCAPPPKPPRTSDEGDYIHMSGIPSTTEQLPPPIPPHIPLSPLPPSSSEQTDTKKLGIFRKVHMELRNLFHHDPNVSSKENAPKHDLQRRNSE